MANVSARLTRSAGERVVDDFVTPDNVAEYMNAGFSYVIDEIDAPKAALIAYCRRNEFTGNHRRCGRADRSDADSVVDLAKTIQDPLAAKLRERLMILARGENSGKRQAGRGLRVLDRGAGLQADGSVP